MCFMNKGCVEVYNFMGFMNKGYNFMGFMNKGSVEVFNFMGFIAFNPTTNITSQLTVRVKVHQHKFDCIGSK